LDVPLVARLVPALLCAVICVGPGCVIHAAGARDGWECVPVVGAIERPSEEQGEVLRCYGQPTAVWRTALATDLWVYCVAGRVAQAIEFDGAGLWLSRNLGGPAALCGGCAESEDGGEVAQSPPGSRRATSERVASTSPLAAASRTRAIGCFGTEGTGGRPPAGGRGM